MNFVQQKHNIEDLTHETEGKKALSKDIAYPLISWFVYPKGKKHFAWIKKEDFSLDYENQEVYPFLPNMENTIHLNVDTTWGPYLCYHPHISGKKIESDKDIVKESKRIENVAGSLLKTEVVCEPDMLEMTITAEKDAIKETDKAIVPFIYCRLPYIDGENKGKEAISASIPAVKKLEKSDLSKDYLLFMNADIHYEYSAPGFFALPKSELNPFREIMKDLEDRVLRGGKK
jgi:hypothetical protein